MKLHQKTTDSQEFLECEKLWVYVVLMGIAGFYGAYTYSIRGGVFCNAQTANFVLFAMSLGNRHWSNAFYYLIPMTAYLGGSILSEAVAKPVKRFLMIRWDTLLIFIEIVTVIFLGFLPENAPYQISQITINFICSMQYNTFRRAQNVPMATTFCTNHLRQTGIALVHAIHHLEDTGGFRRMFLHLGMLSSFVIGGIVATVLCGFFLGKAIWVTLLPLILLLIRLLYADLKKEKGKLDVIPHGH